MTAGSEDLLAHLGWIQGLARELVRDPHRAEDLAQETALAALRARRGEGQGPADGSRLRAWLAAVLRNVLRMDLRAEAARARRERSTARGEAEPGADDVVERAATQHALVELVLALDEPYRTTVLLRFFENLPPRAIAQRLDVPVATVQSRLTRGLARLRERLDHRPGGRQAWLAGVLPLTLAAPAPSLTLATLGALLMNAKLKLALAATVAVGAFTVLWSETRPEPRALERTAGAGEEGHRRSSSGGGASTGANEPPPVHARQAVDAPAAAAPAAGPPQRFATGLVIDATGVPAAGVASDEHGRFRLAAPAAPAEVVADPARHVTLNAGAWTPGSSAEPVVVVAPAIALAGRVVGQHGQALARAQLQFQLPDGFDARFSTSLERSRRLRLETRTDEHGAFALRAPQIDGAALFVTCDSWKPALVSLPPASDDRMLITLAPIRYADGELRGVVLDPLGARVEGARVAMGLTSTMTDAQGEFALSLRRAGYPTAITALKRGHLPAQLEPPVRGGEVRWPARVELTLGGPPLTISGRVVDEKGAAVPGALVWAHDATPFGIVGTLPFSTESLLANGKLPPNAERPSRFADDPLAGNETNDETWHVKEPSAGWHFVTTDASGAFELGGLLPREYRLRALEPKTVAMATSEPIGAGIAGATIRLPLDDVYPRVAGRIVNQDGVPVPGVKLSVFCRTLQRIGRVPGGTLDASVIRHGASTTTGADGTFAFERLPRLETRFSIYGDAILPMPFALEGRTDLDRLEIRVATRCQLEVIVADPERADEVVVGDEGGESLDLVVLRSGSTNAYTSMPLRGGRSGVVAVSSRARTVRLLKSGKVVAEQPVRLRSGEKNEVRF